MAVAIDTSGSIETHTLADFFLQIGAIATAGADVIVVECDAQVQRSYPWKGVVPDAVNGRGGTEFDPVFKWLREEGVRRGVTGCVYLTDGHGPRPTVRPPCPVLWVLTPGGTSAHTAFGPAIAMPR